MASLWQQERASPEKPPCRYGAACYRSHPEHRAQFSHPPDSDLQLAGSHRDRSSIPLSNGLSVVQSSVQIETHGHGDASPLMLILGGPPGSGKSTFADALVQQGASQWTRVCQDIAANGNRGTRQQCLKQAQRALQSRRCVIIDRCNIERDQRSDFIALARSMRTPVHALFYDLPFQLVVQRAAARVAHEGGVQGAMAEGVIRRFLRTKEVPSKLEGFASIFVCKSDEDVQRAFAKYKRVGELQESLPMNPFRKTFGEPLQNGQASIDNQIASRGRNPTVESSEKGLFSQQEHCESAFPREGDFGSVVDDPMDVDYPELQNEERRKREIGASSSEGRLADGERLDETNANGKRKLDDVFIEGRTRAGASSGGNGAGNEKRNSHSGSGEEGKNHPSKDERGAGSGKGPEDSSEGADRAATRDMRTRDKEGEQVYLRLAFPSISTSDFMFDHQQAAEIIVDEVSQFLDRADTKLHLMLMDLSAESDILNRVRRRASDKGLQLGPGRQFQTYGGDITKLRSSGGPESQVIANAANWRLKPGGGGVNAAIYSAAGPDFVQATKRQGDSLFPGAVLPVELPPSSPLRINEGVSHVIHVLGPNMNPARPNCLKGDYEAGERLLRAAYRGLFDAFERLASARGSEPSTSREKTGQARAAEGGSNTQPQKKVKNAFELMMHSAKKHEPGGSSKEVKVAGSSPTGRKEDVKVPGSSPPGRNEEIRKRSGWSGKGAWSEALRDVALHPEKHQDEVLDQEGEVVIIKDLYHKAKVHFLALASVDGLDTSYELRREHVPLLERMVRLGRKWAARASDEDPSLRFRLGFHAEPSMRQVHLHVISQDFESDHLKHKKHWNSFTTPFFVDATAVIEEIEKNGQLARPDTAVTDGLLKKELRCHRCRCAQPNIPRLKAHIRACDAPVPGESLAGATS